MQVRIPGQECIGETGNTVQRYLDGKSNPDDIEAFWACLDKSIKAFLDNTTGADPNRYQPAELAGFVSKYFLDNRPIPASFLRQLMRVKQGVFGGEVDTISRAEIYKILALFQAFSKVSVSLHPYMPLTPSRLVKEGLSEAELNSTMEAIEQASVELGEALKEGLGTYTFAEFNALLAEVRAYYRANGWESDWITDLEKLSDLHPVLKGILVSPPAQEIRPADWQRLFYLVPRYYALFLRYKLHFNQPKSYLEGDGLVHIVKILDESVHLLESSLSTRKDKKISGEEIDGLLNIFEKNGLLPYPKTQIKKLLTLAVNKFIPDPAAKGKLHFSTTNLQELRTLYTYYTEGYRALEGTFTKELGARNYKTGTISRQRAYQLFPPDRSAYTVFNNSTTKVALADIRRNIEKVDVAFDPSAKLVVVPGNGDLKASFFHLVRMHYLRTVNKILLRAYGNQKAGTISEKQVTVMLADLMPVFDFFKFDASGLIKAVKPRMFEASLFLPHSDGNLLLNMDEAMELESIFVSVLSHGPFVHDQLGKVCKAKKQKGKYVIDAGCYQRAFAHNIGLAWKTVPALAATLERLPLDDRSAMIRALDSFLRKGRIGQPFTESDTNSLIQVGYYIELLFHRFDWNRDGFLDQTETKRAYPFFREFIAKKANELGRTKAEEHFKIYNYILAKGKIPGSFWEKVDYIYWQPDTPYRVGRVGIMDVFSTMLAL